MIIESKDVKRESKVEIKDRTSSLKPGKFRENKPGAIVIHSTRTYATFPQLLSYHWKRGFSGVGYHFFISANDEVYQARPVLVEGAHALGFNTSSIGISFYAPDKILTQNARAIGRELIEDIRKNYGDIRVIPHTVAQLEFINRVLEQNGYDERFPDDIECVEPEKFDEIAQKVNKFVGGLSTDKDAKVKGLLKALKNCPGPLFKELVK